MGRNLKPGGSPASVRGSIGSQNPKPDTYYDPQMLTPSELESLKQATHAAFDEANALLTEGGYGKRLK